MNKNQRERECMPNKICGPFFYAYIVFCMPCLTWFWNDAKLKNKSMQVKKMQNIFSLDALYMQANKQNRVKQKQLKRKILLLIKFFSAINFLLNL